MPTNSDDHLPVPTKADRQRLNAARFSSGVGGPDLTTRPGRIRRSHRTRLSKWTT
jgi:hypothetical protein